MSTVKSNKLPTATAPGNTQTGNLQPASTSNGPRQYQNYILVGIVALLVGISVAMVQYKIPTIMAQIMQLFSMNAAAASWLMSIFTLVGVFVALPASGLANRIGPKKPMLIAALFVVLGSIIGLLAQVSWVLILSRAIEGVALTIVTTTGPILVQRCVDPKKIGAAMGIWGLWGSLGSTAAGVITPTLMELMGFEGIWVIYAGFTLLAAVLLMVLIRLPKTGADTAANANAPVVPSTTQSNVQSTPQLSPSPVRPRYRALLTRDIGLFFVGFTTMQICLLAVLAFVPTHLNNEGFDPTVSGFISTIPMLLAIISSPLFGAISDRIGRYKPLLLAALFVMGPCTFGFYISTGALMWVAVLVMGLIGMGGIGLSIAALTKLLPGPQYVPMGMGVMVLVQSVVQFLGTFLVQLLLGPDLTNWFFAGLVIMILGILGTLALAAVKLR
jgi:MFS family permease